MPVVSFSGITFWRWVQECFRYKEFGVSDWPALKNLCCETSAKSLAATDRKLDVIRFTVNSSDCVTSDVSMTAWLTCSAVNCESIVYCHVWWLTHHLKHSHVGLFVSCYYDIQQLSQMLLQLGLVLSGFTPWQRQIIMTGTQLKVENTALTVVCEHTCPVSFIGFGAINVFSLLTLATAQSA